MKLHRIIQLISGELNLEPSLLTSKPMDFPVYHCIQKERQIAANLRMNEKIFKSAGNQGHWKQSIALEKHLRVLE